MRILTLSLTLGFLAISASASFAGCNPKCTGDDICRYEAAGGKFYCKAPPKPKETAGGVVKLKPTSPTPTTRPVTTTTPLGD